MSKYVRICHDMSFLGVFTKCLSVFLSEWGFPNYGVLTHPDIVWLTVYHVWCCLLRSCLLRLRLWRSCDVRHLLAPYEVLVPSHSLKLAFLNEWSLVVCWCFAWFKQWIAMQTHLQITSVWLLTGYERCSCNLTWIIWCFLTALFLSCCSLV